MRVGFHAPLPPARTGVADYAAALLKTLGEYGDVRPGEYGDVNLYHLGNNQLHRADYQKAVERPGAVVLHDAVLQHFFLGSLDRTAYINEFVYNYGEWHRDLALRLWNRRAGSGLGACYFRYPMLKRIAERALAVVVHNRAAARLVREHAPGAKLFEIPHLFARPERLATVAETIRFRESLGIRPGEFVFGVFGYLRESKRLLPVLKTFDEVRRAVPETRLLVVGDFVSSDLARAAGPLMAQPGVLHLPFQAERFFWLAAAAADAAISLRWPPAGETSGITVRMMGIGKPVLVTDAEENAAWPETACLRVASGPAERASLWQYMVLAARFRAVSRELGARAARHIGACHEPAKVAGEYWKVLCALGS